MIRIAFVQTDWFEHLGVLYLAASARRAGHEARLFIGRSASRLVPTLSAFAPDIIAFSATTGGHKKTLELARQLRPRFRAKLILGGAHPTFFPEVIQEPALDAICRGEADLALPRFLDAIDRGEDGADAPGFWVKREDQVIENEPAELVADLDSLPMPARDLLYAAAPWFRRESMQRVMTGRGCPHRCTYCFNRAMRELVDGKGPYIRRRSVGNVIEELIAIKRAGKRTINFVDDTFGLKLSWALEFLERYRSEIGLPFIVNLRPEQAEEELCLALSRAGCYCVQMGVESADEPTRRELLGRNYPDELMKEAAARVHGHGMRLLTYNIVGLPGETAETAAKTLLWNAEQRVEFPRVSLFQPYPRTELGDKWLSGEGGAGGNFEMGESYFRRSPLAGPDVRRIENLHKLFYPFIRLPSARSLIMRLTRLPANPLFDAVFLASMAAQYRGATNRTWPETIQLGIMSLRAYFS